jgi:hypothetical protein
MLKSQDILIALKLVSLEDRRLSRLQLGRELNMSASEVHAGIDRLRKCRLLNEDERPRKAALLEFLVHGMSYVFPPEHGSITRGMCTSYAASPLKEQIVQSDDEMVPVWPHAAGNRRGYALSPLYRSAPDAALKDAQLYELLVLVDAIRDGRVRERKLAVQCLEDRLRSA